MSSSIVRRNSIGGDSNEEFYLKNLMVLANGIPDYFAVIKLPPEWKSSGPCTPGEPIFGGNYGYGLYVKGDLMPLWEHGKCDTVNDEGVTCDTKGCHYKWDAKRQRWRMTCLDHDDQFMS